MVFLSALWSLSLGLAGLAVAVMLLMVLRRAVNERRSRREQAQRKQFVREVLTRLPGGEDGEEGEALVLPSNAIGPLTRVASELFELVRGDDEERLARLLTQAGVLDELVCASRHRKTHRRLEAVRILRRFEDSRAVTALRGRLDDPDRGIRVAAALGLARMGQIPAVRELVAKLDIPPGRIAYSYFPLFRALVPEKTDELLAVLGEEPSGEVKILALDAIGRSGDYTVLPKVIGMTTDLAPEVRVAAVRALGRLGHPAARAAVLARLGDDFWPVRLEAAKCSGEIGLTQAIEPLAGLLEDGQWWVRYRAAEALTHLGPAGLDRLRSAAAEGAAPAAAARTLLSELTGEA